MGPRILYELSQELSILLDGALRGDSDRHVPVFFCHPLDPLEDRQRPEQGTIGILYMTGVVPERNLRQGGVETDRIAADGLRQRLRRPPLWVRVRYVFLVAGGDIEQQLVAIGSVIQTLHDHQCVRLPASGEIPQERGASSEDSNGSADEKGITCPLRLIEGGEGWRELGLPEHRLTLAFEVTCPIPGSRVETVDRIQERGFRFEESAT